MQDGVSAVSWADSLGNHERAYYVNVNGALRARAFDFGSSATWLTINNPAVFLSGPIYAVNLGLGNVWVGATGQFPGDPIRLFIFERDPFYPDTYSTAYPPPPPEEIATNSVVTGAVPATLPCFFLQTASGKVAAYSLFSGGWSVSALHTPTNESTFTDAAAAVAWQRGGERVTSVFVRAADGSVWEAIWENNCTGQPTWMERGNPGVPISSLKYALSAVAYVHPIFEVDVIELFAAGNDAKLYRRFFNGTTWLPWVLLEAPADTAGHAIGGLAAVAPDFSVNPLAESSIFFVGEVSRRPSLVNPPAAYAFERSSNGRLRDHTDAVVGLRTVNFSQPYNGNQRYGWTESSLAERAGRVIVAAMEIRPEPDPQRVAVALSEDDGHTWNTQLIAHQYTVTPDRYFPQGDPSTAVDPQGTAWVLLHEFVAEFGTPAGCDGNPTIFSSKISLGHAPSGSTMFQFEKDPPPEWLLNETVAYLDGPKTVITSDATQHFAWFKACVTSPCLLDGDTLFYMKRLPGQMFSPAVAVAPPQIAWPYLIADVQDNIYIAWVGNDNRIRICPWKNWQLGDGACSPNVIDVTAQTNACAVFGAGELVGFTKQGASMNLRSGAFALGASGKDAEHIFAAFNVTEGTLGTPGCTAGLPPGDIGFIESFDGGLTWSTPVVLSDLPEEQGTDQFMPSVASHDDGTILVTYYDRSPDPAGSLVQQKVAIRRPGSSLWFQGVRQRAANQYSDLGLMPHKCGDGPNTLFIGDYHTAVGGNTHTHALRVDALTGVVQPSVRLQASALSGSSWR